MNRMFLAVIVLGFAVTSAFAQARPVAVTVDADKTNAPKPPAAGTTRVAVFNIGTVFGKYDRANAIKGEVAREMKELQDEAKQLQQNLNVWQTALQKGELPMAKKELYEEKVINARRRLEDMREARAKVGKTQESNLIMLWKDIREATNSYAKEHGIQLVIAYGDPRENDQVDLFPNINRKMQALDQGGAMPFFVAPGADITEALVDRLNRQYREKKGEPAEQEDPR